MTIEFLAFHDQFVSNFAAYEEHDDFAFFDIIQGTQISCTQFEICKKIGAQAFDRFRGRRGLVHEAGLDSRFQNSLRAYWQRPELPVGVFRYGDLEGHGGDPATGKPKQAEGLTSAGAGGTR
jgi:hypothetical protein